MKWLKSPFPLELYLKLQRDLDYFFASMVRPYACCDE